MPWLSCTKVYNEVVADDAVISVFILGSCGASHGLSETCLQMHYPDSCAAGAGADALSSTQESDI